MDNLSEFATYLKRNHLAELAKENLRVVRSMEIPLQKLFAHLPEDQLLQMSIESMGKFLTSLENNTAYEEAFENLRKWEADELPGLRKEDVHPSDLVLIYAAQKKAFFKFLPLYTKDVDTVIKIVNAITDYHVKVQNSAIQMLFKIQVDSNKHLEESEEKFRDLFENATDLIHICDIDGKLQYVNKSWLETMGYEMQEIKGFTINEVIHPDDLNYYREIRKRALQGEMIKEFEITFKSKEGEKIYLEGNVNCKFLNNNPQYTRGIFRNITLRKENAEKIDRYTRELKESEQQIQTIFNNAPDAVIIINSEGNIIRWNPKAEKMFGWSSGEVIGKPLHDFIIPLRHREAHLKGLKRFLETGDGPVLNKTIEIEGINKEGLEIITSLSIAPTLIKGKYIFIAFVRDITSTKKAEVELKRTAEELARSNAELEQFAYVASHDLQEPLRMVNSYVQLLASRYKDKLDQDAKDFIGFAVDGSNRMRNLIYSLLEYSRINRVKPFEWIDVNNIIEDVKHDLEPHLKENKVLIKTTDLPKIYCDPVLIHQLFQNLISNSIKFRGKANPVINISVTKLKNEYLFSVKDNGIGVPKEYWEKVFVIFQRLHSKDKYGGTGIGLAICKKIVERHGGKIWIESEDGKGANFLFTIKDNNYLVRNN